MKSTLALETARALVGGGSWLQGGAHVMVQRRLLRALIIQTEIDPGLFDDRREAVGLGEDSPLAQRLSDYSERSFRLDAAGMHDLRETIEYEEYSLLVLDPIGRMWPYTHAPTGTSFDENDKAHVTYVLERLLDLGITTVFVHHDPKPRERGFRPRSSGSSALLNIPDTRILVDRDARDPDWLTLEVRSRNLERLNLGPGHPRGAVNVRLENRRLVVRPRLDKAGRAVAQ